MMLQLSWYAMDKMKIEFFPCFWIPFFLQSGFLAVLSLIFRIRVRTPQWAETHIDPPKNPKNCITVL